MAHPRDPIKSRREPHEVRSDGPYLDDEIREQQQKALGVTPGWCTGDIDFDEDGSIFIRNPYLANAIERMLKRNSAKFDAGTAPFVFRLTRDEGFSGPKVNIVC
ncbi:MAG TPA: hypothetical protein VFS09_07915 [Candidatus Eisenbacteria bacterium]|nr:hypothetical protein [Candidatus Eisenbacteria bacterium]